jgi:hypothetical protein
MCNSASQQATQTTTATPEEKAMEGIQLGQMQQYAPAQTQMYNNAFGLGNQLLTSFGDKNSNMWQSLIGGVTSDQMNAQAMQANRLTNASLNQSGLIDSGVGKVMSARAISDSMNSNAEFNVGALQNALNLALSGQAQVQSPAQSNTGQLASQLAGLRTVNSSGTSTPGMMTTIGQGMSAAGGLIGGISGIGSMGGGMSSLFKAGPTSIGSYQGYRSY